MNSKNSNANARIRSYEEIRQIVARRIAGRPLRPHAIILRRKRPRPIGTQPDSQEIYSDIKVQFDSIVTRLLNCSSRKRRKSAFGKRAQITSNQFQNESKRRKDRRLKVQTRDDDNRSPIAGRGDSSLPLALAQFGDDEAIEDTRLKTSLAGWLVDKMSLSHQTIILKHCKSCGLQLHPHSKNCDHCGVLCN